MIDIKKLKSDPDWFQKKIQEKGINILVKNVVELEKERNTFIKSIEELNQKRKIISKSKNPSEEGKKIKADLKKLEESLKIVETKFQDTLSKIPNPAFDEVPIGGEDKSLVVGKNFEPVKFNFTPKAHEELGKSLNIIDIESAAKVSGSRFYYLRGKGAELELALLNYAREIIAEKNFVFILPPVLINSLSMKGMGYLEHGGNEESYYLERDDLYLVGTAEQSIGPMHRDEVLNVDQLPLRYMGYSPSFRRESGSYGKDTKGIIRVHQFNKLEMFVFCTPEQSQFEHNLILELEKTLVEGLKLPYQILNIASGDLGLPAAKKYDIEVWFPSQLRYRETHSTSNTTDFQSRRLNIKFVNKNNEKELVHTVNGTAFAFGRIIAAIMENFQTESGSIIIPDVLHKYTGFKSIE